MADKAVERGNDGLVLRAGDAVLRAATVLADRFGLRDSDVLEVVHGAEQLAIAVAQASRQSPELGELVAARLDANGEHDIAHQLRNSFHETRALN